MGWFGSKKKRVSHYLSDPGDWHFASLYKHNIELAVARLDRSHIFEMHKEQFVSRPLGHWEAKGLVHFDYGGPLIPFQLSIGGVGYDDEGRLGRFHVERIQPHNDSNYPEEHKDSFLRLAGYINDPSGDTGAMLEKAMQQAAISRKQFLHVRLCKDAADPEAAAAQVREKQYSDSLPITSFVVGECIQLVAPPAALMWDDL
jgi:hypothetical protein